MADDQYFRYRPSQVGKDCKILQKRFWEQSSTPSPKWDNTVTIPHNEGPRAFQWALPHSGKILQYRIIRGSEEP